MVNILTDQFIIHTAVTDPILDS